MKKRTKLNGTTMTPIPAIATPENLPVDVIMGKLKEKYDLKAERTVKVAKVREIRKEIYNLSQKINRLEVEIDKTLIVKVLKEQYEEVKDGRK